jgi:hypothetical protein
VVPAPAATGDRSPTVHGGSDARPDPAAGRSLAEMTGPDCITICRSRHRRLAKLIRPGGVLEDYDFARTFDLFEVALADFASLGSLLCRLQSRPDCAVVRGRIIDPARARGVRRLVLPDHETGDQPTLRDVPHRWLALDLDGVARPDDVPATDLAGCGHAAIQRLPGAFHGVRCIAAASASHGIKPGCRLRLWYWLDRPTTGDELTRWLRAAPVDASLNRPAQLCYTAGPVFAPGAGDRLAARMVTLLGEPVVRVPAAETLRPSPPSPPSRSARFRRGSPDRHITAILTGVLTRLEAAPDGQRHARLRAASVTMGGLLDVAGIREADAARVLMDAVCRAGGAAVVETNAAATIAWGLARGRQSPLSLGNDHA